MVVGEGSMVAGEGTGMGSSRCTGSMSLPAAGQAHVSPMNQINPVEGARFLQKLPRSMPGQVHWLHELACSRAQHTSVFCML